MNLSIQSVSGFFTVQDQDLNITVYASGDNAVLSPGQYCYWQSDDQGAVVFDFFASISMTGGHYSALNLSNVTPQEISALIYSGDPLMTDLSSTFYSNTSNYSIGSLPGITSFVAPFNSNLTMSDMLNIVSVDVSNTNTGSVSLTNVPVLTELLLTNNPSLNLLMVDGALVLEELIMPVSVVLSDLVFNNCPLLTDVDVSVAFGGTMIAGTVRFTDCALSQTSVDNLISALDDIAFIGVCDITGGTSAAPSGPAIAAVANMILNGATITTN